MHNIRVGIAEQAEAQEKSPFTSNTEMLTIGTFEEIED